MTARAFFEPLRSLAHGSISGVHANVGSATTHTVRAFKISNDTQGDMIFSATPGQDDMFVKAGGYDTWDVQSNINPDKDDKYVLPVGTQFRVKESTAPVSGAVYITVFV